jgi:hypothetical protein
MASYEYKDCGLCDDSLPIDKFRKYRGRINKNCNECNDKFNKIKRISNIKKTMGTEKKAPIDKTDKIHIINRILDLLE